MKDIEAVGVESRERLLRRLTTLQEWDVIVIGGGATGLGIAMDAASRQYKTLLVEQADFAKGTSSKATKLVHGGVRYMAQGDLGLVREACYERGLLLKNAPHLTKNETFVIPNYRWFDNIKYTIGLKFYDLLAGKLSLGASKYISKRKTLEALPNIKEEGLKGGVTYQDGQFDDSRLALNVAQTAIEQGGCVLNYIQVTGFIKGNNKKVVGVEMKDVETGVAYSAIGKTIINATGVYVDSVLQMDRTDAPNMIRPSKGVHITLDRSFLPGAHALMIPETSDGRVLFAVPWHDTLIVGTTDTLYDKAELEPQAVEEDIDFILNTAAAYMVRKPLRSDVRSVFAGLRPLAAPKADGGKTKEISRSHKIIVSESGLITITGGKWTTFRRMAQDTVQKAIDNGHLPYKKCVTENLNVHGHTNQPDINHPLHFYGSDLPYVEALGVENPAWSEPLVAGHPFTKAQVIWAVRHEYARKVEDVLARRFRLLLLDSKAALKAAPAVAQLMAEELGKDADWIQRELEGFKALALGYSLN
ncbi:glycerol-3-phosphate dehydrogenase [Dyadobacter jejuensis]|uniref:Glycerol-3-phosphate dehydrogenase n=1 Tax=Dyadobacter jejuensis TaxID=1082580 RepID=A0A316AHT0_9BACT|nr:glycerol-3-phosphate dehydrogenase/oxidase [Dyadobacter jejuensis]PWJ57243.1 glycerol-3-phosphate dehydrogenase [Dyadobacter jejuensis]